MRLWSIHPGHLDPRGLVALWREGLLAQTVLNDKTKGYRHHPQLARFRAQRSPASAIAGYLGAVHAESVERGYRFDATRIAPRAAAARIEVPQGQIDFEWSHLKKKLAARAPDWLEGQAESPPRIHPLFRVVPGGVAHWERV